MNNELYIFVIFIIIKSAELYDKQLWDLNY